MEYAMCWIVRFEGTITQGPNAGKSYTFETSWAGVMFDSLDLARAKLAEYRLKEPKLVYRLLSREYIQTGPRDGRFQEKVIEG